MKFDVVLHPNDVLRQTAKPVTTITDLIRNQLNAMVETMYYADGIGLAANQVGLLHRIIVIDVEQRENGGDRNPIKLINPEITAVSDDVWLCREGCLSIPGQFAEVERPYEIEVKYLDETGKEQKITGEGLLSSCLQHEIDHLNGVLFPDHLSRLKRDMLWKRYTKLSKEHENG